jgi:ribosomal protein S18 acetylase RimI-like enzyme
MDLEWREGTNRFEKPGEVLLGAHKGHRIVGICGLNVDPYVTDPHAGRLRHLYVAREVRMRGIGRQLVRLALVGAASHFRVIRLRADTVGASDFYRRIGFLKAVDATTTHYLNIGTKTPNLGADDRFPGTGRSG